mmetsp:Transcript_4385/g.7824  ORF Transcript_4385/g.7824 Transcript_4385/m.7824 type:complete len:345 (-) Transcript_4385:434-1468(-)
MLYVPRLPGVPASYWLDPNRYSLGCEIDNVVTSDNIRLQGWMLFPKSLDASTDASSSSFNSSTSSDSSDSPIAKMPFQLSRAEAIGHRRRRPTLLFFQENAGNISYRLPFFKALIEYLNCNIYAISYRGYGLSEGKPSEAGLKRDAAAALRAAIAREDVNEDLLLVYGRSLGGAVAIHLLAEDELAQQKVKGLIIENTFASVEEMASQILPPLGYLIGRGRLFNFLVTNKWKNEDAIAKVTVPTLLLASLEDEMVPFEQMLHLHKAARVATAAGREKRQANALNDSATSASASKTADKPILPFLKFVELPKAHHMDAYDMNPEAYWPEMHTFFSRVLNSRPASQ